MFSQLFSYICDALAPKATSVVEGVDGFISPFLASIVTDHNNGQPPDVPFSFANTLATKIETKVNEAQSYIDQGRARVQSIEDEIHALADEFWLYKNLVTGDVQRYEVNKDKVEALRYPSVYHGITGLQVVLMMLMETVGVDQGDGWLGKGRKVEQLEVVEKPTSKVNLDEDRPSESFTADNNHESTMITERDDRDDLQEIDELYHGLCLQLDELKKPRDAFRDSRPGEYETLSALSADSQPRFEFEDDGYYTHIYRRSRKLRRSRILDPLETLSTSSTSSSISSSIFSLNTPELGRSPMSTPASSPPSTPRCVTPSESYSSIGSISSRASLKLKARKGSSDYALPPLSSSTRRAAKYTPRITTPAPTTERAAWGSPLGYTPSKANGVSTKTTSTARSPLASTTNKTPRKPSPLGTSLPVTPEKKVIKVRDVENIPAMRTRPTATRPSRSTNTTTTTTTSTTASKRKVWV